jgi:hypothetical protein
MEAAIVASLSGSVAPGLERVVSPLELLFDRVDVFAIGQLGVLWVADGDARLVPGRLRAGYLRGRVRAALAARPRPDASISDSVTQIWRLATGEALSHSSCGPQFASVTARMGVVGEELWALSGAWETALDPRTPHEEA